MNAAISNRIEYLRENSKRELVEAERLAILADLIPEDVEITSLWEWTSSETLGITLQTKTMDAAARLRACFGIRTWEKDLHANWNGEPTTSYTGTGDLGADDRLEPRLKKLEVKIVVNGQLPQSCRIVKKKRVIPPSDKPVEVEEFVVECDGKAD